jgi:hypothetical protein
MCSEYEELLTARSGASIAGTKIHPLLLKTYGRGTKMINRGGYHNRLGSKVKVNRSFPRQFKCSP